MSPFGSGPRPTPPTPRLGTPRTRVLQAVADRSTPATLGNLHDDLGGHPNSTRRHLTALESERLLRSVSTPATGGRGRPAHAWAVTADGLRALADGTGAGQTELLIAIAEHLSAEPDAAERAHEVGRRWTDHLPPVRTISELTHRMAALGFSPRTQPDKGLGLEGDGGQDGHVTDTGRQQPQHGISVDVLLTTCPMLAAAESMPEVVCGIHEGALRRSLEASGATVQLEPFAEQGCWVRVLGLA